jgi:hypothetical protein
MSPEANRFRKAGHHREDRIDCGRGGGGAVVAGDPV